VKIAVVIPCYRVARHVLDLIARIGAEVELIVAVDDACPDGSGRLIEERCRDPRVRVVRHESNLGVGGAVMTGYGVALEAGATVLVKLDGDGQMDPAFIPQLVAPLQAGMADYAKGNRLYDPEGLRLMPRSRLLGNAALSFLAKLSSGYWTVMDPANGYTAITALALGHVPLAKVDEGYFFETDLLFRLNIARAVVVDVPMPARYGDETSNLHVIREVLPFLRGNLRNFLKRIVYAYFLRGFSVASLELMLSLDLPRPGYLIGKFLGFAVVALGVAAIVTVPVAALAPIHAALAWGCSLALELLIIAALSVFCITTFTQLLPAAAFVTAFYLLARSITAIQLMSVSSLLGVDGFGQDDRSLGKSPGLVGTEHIHAAEILDRLQTPNDHTPAGQARRTGRKSNAHDCRQQFGRQADGKRDREEQRLDDRPAEQDVGGEHAQHQDDHDAD